MYATYDTFSIGGGIWGQMAEADDLLRAQTLAAQAKRFMDRARGSQSAVKDVPCGKIVSPLVFLSYCGILIKADT